MFLTVYLVKNIFKNSPSWDLSNNFEIFMFIDLKKLSQDWHSFSLITQKLFFAIEFICYKIEYKFVYNSMKIINWL